MTEREMDASSTLTKTYWGQFKNVNYDKSE